jgi:hypothetical protein
MFNFHVLAPVPSRLTRALADLARRSFRLPCACAHWAGCWYDETGGGDVRRPSGGPTAAAAKRVTDATDTTND